MEIKIMDINNDADEMLNIDYPAEQCRYRKWNEEKQCWEKSMNCPICSATCPARAKFFEEIGKKQYKDGIINYWK